MPGHGARAGSHYFFRRQFLRPVRAGTDYLSATMRLTPNVAPGSQTASGGTFARWTDAPSRTYTLSSTVGAGYVLKYACWRTNAPVAQGSSLTADLPSGATLTWDLGYTVGAAWYQARGGDVYAASGLASPVPAGVSPRVMLQSGTPGLPGVVTYGASYDFDSSTGTGRDLVSSTGWLANDTYPATDFYTMMYNRFDSPDPTHTGDTTFTGKPASGTYMVEGNLVIDNAAWNVGRD
ncbi:MAG: hypothetical protein HND47_22485 [Chloroflexi bacterium]|nr:hypothetical protein [Chloroflexota bacterium]